MAAKKSAKKASTKGTTKATTKGAGKSSSSSSNKPKLPPRIFAQVSPHSVGGSSLFAAQEQINSETIPNFFSESDVVEEAVARLIEAGFEILQITPLTINIAGSAEAYRRAFDTNIVAEERPVIKSMNRHTTATFIDSTDTAMSGFIDTSNGAFANSIEGIAIEEPRFPMAASMFAPLKSYWHLRVPGDVSLGCNADRAHRTLITGKGIKVAMCDTGWFKHPYFVGRGYKSAPVTLAPATANPLKDESGHGTGESANIFAVAPDVDFMPVKMNFSNSTAAFNTAVGLNPHIITCSWGSSKQNPPLSAADQTLAAAIAAAVASGIIVIFSAGNGHWGFPGQHPDVISAGGVFMKPDETLSASNYSSGFMSNIYPNRRVPDLSGLVGMLPKAIYIMLPLEPGDDIDSGNSGGTHPNGDETTGNDGWAAFSGTSAAAPQLAGAAALIKQACPALSPAKVRQILRQSARDVTTGTCHPNTGGNAAIAGPDTATGNGLVDAHKAVLLAKLQCLGPIRPITITPIGVQPPITVQPPIRVQPPIVPPPILVSPPVRPITVQPPVRPIHPPVLTPVQPPRPIAPIVNPPPLAEAMEQTENYLMEELTEAASPSQLSADDIESLTEMVLNSDLDMDS